MRGAARVDNDIVVQNVGAVETVTTRTLTNWTRPQSLSAGTGAQFRPGVLTFALTLDRKCGWYSSLTRDALCILYDRILDIAGR